MPDRRKRIALLLFSLAILSILLIAISLPGLELKAGTPIPSGDGQGTVQIPSFTGSTSSSTGFANSLVLGIISLVLLGSFIYIMVNFITRMDIKRFIRNMILLIILVALLLLLPKLPVGQPSPGSMDLANSEVVPTGAYSVSPLGEPPQSFLWIVLGILTLAVAVLLLWFFLRRRYATLGEDRIVQEAQSALKDLKMGQDLKSVILRCYLQMINILKEEQGIERDANLTAREFMELLQARGISPSPVRQLTLLFEAARYSVLKPNEREEQIGIDCLNQIISDSQKVVK